MAWGGEGRDWAAADSAAEGGARLRAGGERGAQSQPRRHCSRAPNSGGGGGGGGGGAARRRDDPAPRPPATRARPSARGLASAAAPGAPLVGGRARRGAGPGRGGGRLRRPSLTEPEAGSRGGLGKCLDCELFQNSVLRTHYFNIWEKHNQRHAAGRKGKHLTSIRCTLD
ncbi:zinc finger protein 503-like isoform X2 [Sapajus apella]|uniref:Zinc finger protein 503-like isoform X2 n=1 Tax=Sapajus apella TaxID=9515 RepID=A0A6J3HSF6_SAPAP|nr:zinc finger protein 503-like isoform X2 [Sapajus apella]